MSNDDKQPIIIHFSLDTSYDARGHHEYFQAPDDFADKTPEERQAFLDKEVDLWREETVDRSWKVYEGHDEAEAETKDQWGSQYSPDQLDERW